MLKKLNLFFSILLCTGIAANINCIKKTDESRRGITDTIIKIGQWGPQSGPAGLWGAIAKGTGLYFKIINEEGGINGRKIEYYLRDDNYVPARTREEVKKLVEDRAVFGFVGGVGTSTGMTVKKYLDEKKVPWIAPSSGSYRWGYPPTKYLFSFFPLYHTESAILVDYAVKELGKKRIAVFYQNDEYGKFGLYGAEVALEKLGLKVVESVSIESTDSDLSSQAMKLKNSDADAVILWVIPKHAGTILGEAAKIGFKPQFMVPSTLSDMAIMHKVTRGLWKNVIYTAFVEPPDSRHPLMKKYREAQKKYAPGEQWGIFYYMGIMFAEPMVEALRRCGRDLTVESFVNAMESLQNFQGIGPKISFGPNIRQGSNSVFLNKCLSETKSLKLTDWRTSDISLEEVLKRYK